MPDGTQTRRTLRAISKKKDSDQEFFQMTYLSLLLPHPQKNKLIEIQGNTYCDALYQQVLATFKPFYEWNDWIRIQMD